MQRSVADFFGVGDEDEEDKDLMRQKWRNRSIMLHSNKLIGGKIKQESVAVDSDSVFEGTAPARGAPDTVDAPGGSLSASYPSSALSSSFRKTPHPVDPFARRVMRQDSKGSKGSTYFARQQSRISTASSSRRSLRMHPRQRNRKDSVLKMAVDGFSSVLVKISYAWPKICCMACK